MKGKRKTWTLLIIAVAICLISGLVQNLILSSGGKVSVTMLKSAENSSTIEVDGESQSFDGLVVSGALFVPEQASEDHKLPAIVLTHGYLNNWQKQYQNAIELSRRGFIVLAVDRSGHGDYTQEIAGSAGFGGTTADYDQTLTNAGRYLYNLPYVDREKIGVSGHSMGGFATSYALMQDGTDAYGTGIRLFSAGLMQAWDTFYYAAPGVSVGILKSNDDEFFFSGTDPVTGEEYLSREWLTSSAARSFVGLDPAATDEVVVSNHIYVGGVDEGVTTGGETAEPGFRVVYEANEIHTLNHFSITSAANVTNFFYTAFGVPDGYEYLAEGNQTWWIKEAVSAVGIVGYYLMLLPIADLLLALPVFSSLRRKEGALALEQQKLPMLKGARAWIGVLVVGLVGTFFAGFGLRAVSNFAAETWHISPWFPQEHTNWLAYWCMINGLVVLALTVAVFAINWVIDTRRGNKAAGVNELIGSARAEGGAKTVFKALCVAALTFAISMLFVWMIERLMNADFRLWLYTIKTTKMDKIPTALRYLPIFFIFYGINAWTACNSRYRNLPGWASTLMTCIFNCLGIGLIFIIQYYTFKTTGALWHDDMGTRYPTLLTIIPILCVSAVYNKKLCDKTGNCWTGAFLTAIMATFACVSGSSASTPYTFL